MKCVQSPPAPNGTVTILRCDEYEAKLLVAKGWHYVPKSIWKRHVRPNLGAARETAKQVVAEQFGAKGLRRV